MMLSLRRTCLEFFKANWLSAVILIIFFMAGLVFGAIGAKSLDQQTKVELSKTMDNFFSKIPGFTLDREAIVKDSLLKNLYIIVSMYVLGLSVIGALLVPVLVFTRGFTLGFTMGFLVFDRAWKGVLLSVISVIPQNLLFIPALLISGLITLTFSLYFVRGRLMFKGFETTRPLLLYTLGMLLALFLTAAGSLTESYVTPVLIKYTTALLY